MRQRSPIQNFSNRGCRQPLAAIRWSGPCVTDLQIIPRHEWKREIPREDHRAVHDGTVVLNDQRAVFTIAEGPPMVEQPPQVEGFLAVARWNQLRQRRTPELDSIFGRQAYSCVARLITISGEDQVTRVRDDLRRDQSIRMLEVGCATRIQTRHASGTVCARRSAPMVFAAAD